jgi:AI-2 transport protein TqsA
MAETRINWPAPVVLAALVIIVAGMRAAGDLLEPFLVAIFLSIVCAPGATWLRQRGCPEALAVVLVLIALVVVLGLAALGLGTSINGFLRELPAYQAALSERVGGLLAGLAGLGLEMDTAQLRAQLDPGAVMNLAGKVASRFGSALGNTLLVLLTVAFILLEAVRFPAKLHAALGDAGRGLVAFDRFSDGVKQYLAIKSMVSLATGLLVWLMLWILDVDYPLLWGALAFLFNYIPNIGSFLAAIPACLLAFVLHGTGIALIAAAGYAVINVVMGSVIEPRFMGRSLGLSTLVVFISLVFWGWVLGPVGMVLSVPLTMILRIALESREGGHWLAVLLGPEVDTPREGQS